MFPVHEVSDLELAFPARIMHLLPDWSAIPEEFQNGNTKWHKLQRDWFYHGLASLTLKPKEGVDQRMALRHLKAIQSSFEPKHEHKSASVAYLLSEWFDDAEWTPATGEED